MKLGSQFLPRNWKVAKLGDFADWITKGSTPTTYGFEWQERGILFLRSECVLPGRLSLQGSMYISKDAHVAMSRSIIQPGDILIRITGDIGIACIYPNNLGEANINQHLARVRIREKDKLLPEYALMILNSPDTLKSHYEIERGVTHPHLSLEQIRDLEVPLPPIAEQKRIATIAQKADRLRRTRRYTLELSDSYLRSVFLKMFGDLCSYESRELNEICSKISDCKHYTPRYVPEGIPLIRTNDVTPGVFKRMSEKCTRLNDEA